MSIIQLIKHAQKQQQQQQNTKLDRRKKTVNRNFAEEIQILGLLRERH